MERRACVFGAVVGLSSSMFAMADAPLSLQERIRSEPTYPKLRNAAYKLLTGGYNAGSVYPEIWIRDLNTFLVPSLDVNPAGTLRQNLLTTLSFQGSDGNIPDGYTPDSMTPHKNTIETDQESAMVQAVYKYVNRTGDRSILNQTVGGQRVVDRLESALNYPRQNRYSSQHGLIWGGTTADWGDVQPEDNPGTQLNGNSHRAIDIYDNAMHVIAIDNFLKLTRDDASCQATWQPILNQTKQNIRTVLWDDAKQKFRPHVYLDASPFPTSINEDAIYYQGGTQVAIEAGILTPAEVATSVQTMIANKQAAGANSIGLSVYPAYPAGTFANPILSTPYTYQNGGDWTWFGAPMVQQMVKYGQVQQAVTELQPMINRVLDNNDNFSEWNALNGAPMGSGTYRGTAGVLVQAIHSLRDWAADPAAPKIIAPVWVTASSAYNEQGQGGELLRNNSGLSSYLVSGDAIPSVYPTHDTADVSTMWLAAQSDTNKSVMFDLGGSYNITGFHLWNYNQATQGLFATRGITQAEVSISTDGVTFGAPVVMVFDLADGTLNYAGGDYVLAALNVRAVRFSDMQNPANTDGYLGLSEIRFFGTPVPEPSGLSVVAIAALGLMRRRGQSNKAR